MKPPDPAGARAYGESVPEDILFTVKALYAITLINHYGNVRKLWITIVASMLVLG